MNPKLCKCGRFMEVRLSKTKPESSEYYCPVCHKSHKMEYEHVDYWRNNKQ